MALLHRAQLTPSKLELLTGWLPAQPWYAGPAQPTVTRVAGFRFDDPDGEVGIETLLVRADDGPMLQVPLTYRGAPLDGAEEALVGTMDHSVLGPRWVYDAPADPVYVTTLLATMVDGGTGAREEVLEDGRVVERRPDATVRGSGRLASGEGATGRRPARPDPRTVALVRTGAWTVAVRRVVDDAPVDDAGAAARLVGTWDGAPDDVLLAAAWQD